MKILHLMFTKEWSWGLTMRELEKSLPQCEWKNQMVDSTVVNVPYDVILSQQITLMRNITDKNRTVCRLGGNRTVDEDRPGAFDNEIKQVYAVIATNKRLFDISKKINPNTHLIPNGLDLDKWVPDKSRSGVFVAGFVGNITAPAYREYKGYDLVESACKTVKVGLKTALFQDEQIPHGKMRDRFYSQISVLVHPSKGEGCSNAIMEALACGVPVITTRKAGYHGEMLEDGVNVLFCERTVESITKCLRRLMIGRSSKTLRKTLSENGRKFAEEHHDVKKIAKQYDAIFQSCYQANQKKEKVETADKDTWVKVRAVEPLYEEGNHPAGSVFSLTLFRARQLGNLVEIINEKKEEKEASK